MSNGKTIPLEERERILLDLAVDHIRCLDKINVLARACLLCDSDIPLLRAAMYVIWHMGYKSWKNGHETYGKVVRGGAE